MQQYFYNLGSAYGFLSGTGTPIPYQSSLNTITHKTTGYWRYNNVTYTTSYSSSPHSLVLTNCATSVSVTLPVGFNPTFVRCFMIDRFIIYVDSLKRCVAINLEDNSIRSLNLTFSGESIDSVLSMVGNGVDFAIVATKDSNTLCLKSTNVEFDGTNLNITIEKLFQAATSTHLGEALVATSSTQAFYWSDGSQPVLVRVTTLGVFTIDLDVDTTQTPVLVKVPNFIATASGTIEYSTGVITLDNGSIQGANASYDAAIVRPTEKSYIMVDNVL